MDPHVDKYLLDSAQKLWQPEYQDKLSNEDVEEIVDNISDFFEVLIEWGNTSNEPTESRLE